MGYIDEMMMDHENKNNEVSFDLSQSTISVKLTEIGEEIIKRLDPNGNRQKNSEGYYEIFSDELFTLYGSLLMRNSNAKISDLIDSSILINTVYLKGQNDISIKNR